MRTNEVYLRHMLDAIEQISEYVNGSDWTGRRRPGRPGRCTRGHGPSRAVHKSKHGVSRWGSFEAIVVSKRGGPRSGIRQEVFKPTPGPLRRGGKPGISDVGKKLSGRL